MRGMVPKNREERFDHFRWKKRRELSGSSSCSRKRARIMSELEVSRRSFSFAVGVSMGLGSWNGFLAIINIFSAIWLRVC